MFSVVYWNQHVRPSIRVSVCVQNTSFCQSAGRDIPIPKQALVFMCLQYKSFENTVGKGEIAHKEQFLLFPQCFQPVCRIWEESKI